MILFSFFLSLMANAQAEFAAPKGIESDSGIFGPKYAVLEQSMAKIGLDYHQVAEWIHYGKSIQGRPLGVMKLSWKNAPTGTFQGSRPAVVITGAHHGDEYLNLVDRFPLEMIRAATQDTGTKKFLSLGGIIYLVPVFNPDGYDERNRENDAGADLNRDYDMIPKNDPRFRQPETKYWADYIENEIRSQDLNLRMAVDYHCCIGALLYPWSYTAARIPQPGRSYHESWGRQMMDFLGSNYAVGISEDIIGYTAEGTSKDYYYAKYGALAFTFEGAYKKEKNNLSKHLQMWNFVLGNLQ